MALPRENRLPLRFERDRISREGKTFYTQNLTLVAAPSTQSDKAVRTASSALNQTKGGSPLELLTDNHEPITSVVPRFGILLSKKVAKRAVDRNLIRRRVSSAIAGLLPQFPVSDYLVIPKRSVLEIPHTALVADFSFLLSKIK